MVIKLTEAEVEWLFELFCSLGTTAIDEIMFDDVAESIENKLKENRT